MTEFAEALDLDMEAFTTCFESGEHAQDVQDSFDAGVEQGVGSTPTIFVNGERIDYTGWESLADLLDELIGD